MTVVFIKRECPKHPGCYALGSRCDRCIDEDFGRRTYELFTGWKLRYAALLSEHVVDAEAGESQ